MELGSADEQNQQREGTVEAWARSADNPVGVGMVSKRDFGAGVGMYIPPPWRPCIVVEVTHDAKGQ